MNSRKLVQTADSTLNNIDFADRPKQQCTEAAGEIHRRFDAILKSATRRLSPRRESHFGNRRVKGLVRSESAVRAKGHQAYQRIAPVKVGRTIRVRPKRICPRHKGEVLVKTDRQAQKTLIDLVFSKAGCKKTVTRYVGPKAFCHDARLTIIRLQSVEVISCSAGVCRRGLFTNVLFFAFRIA